MFYILVTAPMDQIFVGPFDTEQAADDHAAMIRERDDHGAMTISADEMRDSVATFGPLPVQEP